MAEIKTIKDIKRLFPEGEIKSNLDRILKWCIDDGKILIDAGEMSKAIYLRIGFEGDADKSIELKLTLVFQAIIHEKSQEEKDEYQKEKTYTNGMKKKKSKFIQYKMFTKEVGAMRGKGDAVSILYADSDKEAIRWAKEYFTRSNSGIWSGIPELVLVAEYKNEDVELIRLGQ